MLKFDEAKLKEILVKEEGYEEDVAVRKVNMVKKLDERLQEVLDTWMRDRSVSESVSVEGITVKMIMDKSKYNFIEVLATLDWFLNNPQYAAKFKKDPIIRRDEILPPDESFIRYVYETFGKGGKNKK